MKKSIKYDIPFVGLKNGKHSFEFNVDTRFFEEYKYGDFNSIVAKVDVLLDKKVNLLELNFSFNGLANVPCDITMEDFDLPIEGKMDLVVKFGAEFDDTNDEILILPHGESVIDISQYIYDMILLSMPQKRIHPGVLDGTLKSTVLDILGYNDSTSNSGVETEINEEDKKEEIDPRWDELKKLLK